MDALRKQRRGDTGKDVSETNNDDDENKEVKNKSNDDDESKEELSEE